MHTVESLTLYERNCMVTSYRITYFNKNFSREPSCGEVELPNSCRDQTHVLSLVQLSTSHSSHTQLGITSTMLSPSMLVQTLSCHIQTAAVRALVRLESQVYHELDPAAFPQEVRIVLLHFEQSASNLLTGRQRETLTCTCTLVIVNIWKPPRLLITVNKHLVSTTTQISINVPPKLENIVWFGVVGLQHRYTKRYWAINLTAIASSISCLNINPSFLIQTFGKPRIYY